MVAPPIPEKYSTRAPAYPIEVGLKRSIAERLATPLILRRTVREYAGAGWRSARESAAFWRSRRETTAVFAGCLVLVTVRFVSTCEKV